MPYLERQHDQLVDALLHRQPMLFLQQWVCVTWRLMNDPRGIVLYSPQHVDGAG